MKAASIRNVISPYLYPVLTKKVRRVVNFVTKGGVLRPWSKIRGAPQKVDLLPLASRQVTPNEVHYTTVEYHGLMGQNNMHGIYSILKPVLFGKNK